MFHGLNKLTLLDFPGHMACTLFTGNCNFRCPFCHNASLVTDPSSEPAISEEEILDFLSSRRNKLEGVCITGGEPTLYRNLPDFIKRIKDLSFLVKLDTNGTNPDMLISLVDSGLIDMVAVDVKSSLKNYELACGIKNPDLKSIERTFDFLLENKVDYEFRTTVVDPIHSIEDFRDIGKRLKGAKAYFLQQFQDSGNLISSEGLKAYPIETLEKFKDVVKEFIPNTSIRGV